MTDREKPTSDNAPEQPGERRPADDLVSDLWEGIDFERMTTREQMDELLTVEGGHAPDPVRMRKAKKLYELAERRETKEISPHDLDLNVIYQLNAVGLPLTRREMSDETGNQALVLTPEEFETLGFLDFIHVSGERMVIEAESLDPNDVFVLFPDGLGDVSED